MELEDFSRGNAWLLLKEPSLFGPIEKSKEGSFLVVFAFLSPLTFVSRQVFVPGCRFLRLASPTMPQHTYVSSAIRTFKISLCIKDCWELNHSKFSNSLQKKSISLIVSVKIMSLIVSVRYILVTVLNFFSGAQNRVWFFFSRPAAGLTNQVRVRDSWAGAPLNWRRYFGIIIYNYRSRVQPPSVGIC